MIESLAIRLGIMLVALAVSFSSGFALGMKWESDSRDAAELKRVKDVEIRIQKVVEERERVVTKYVNRIVKIYVDRDRVIQEVDKHATTIPDPRECWLADERVRNINDAGGAPSERGSAASVPADPEAAERKPSSGGEVGSGLSLPIPRMFRSPSNGGGDPEITR